MLQATKNEISAELSGTTQKLSTLANDYNELQKEVTTLRAEQEAVEELKAHVESQHQALTSGASDAEQSKCYFAVIGFSWL